MFANIVLDIAFTAEPQFVDDFSLLENTIVFNSHLELDVFVNSLLNVRPDFATAYKNEWTLLSSFDRAFWLRHLRDQQAESYKPHPKVYIYEPIFTM